VSDETIAELAEVLRRPNFNKYVSEARRLEFLSALVHAADVIEVIDVVAERREDDKFLALALTGKASHIITGDLDLLVLHPFRGIAIVSPQSFLADLGTEASP
jgi:hypothetical protein